VDLPLTGICYKYNAHCANALSSCIVMLYMCCTDTACPETLSASNQVATGGSGYTHLNSSRVTVDLPLLYCAMCKHNQHSHSDAVLALH
jgi:hypothetical protein